MGNGKKTRPSTNGDEGRADNGKFAAGWKGGPGNPFAKHTARLRASLLKAVTPDDIKRIAHKMIRNAKSGNVASVHELFDRLFGKANQPIQLQGEDGQAAVLQLKHTFNYAGFTELFERSGAAGTNGNGRGAPSANGHREPLHPET